MVARTDARNRRPEPTGGVALHVLGRLAILRQAYSQATDPPEVQIPDPRFSGPVAVSDFYSAYVRCP